jgi:hypothetical protein
VVLVVVVRVLTLAVVAVRLEQQILVAAVAAARINTAALETLRENRVAQALFAFGTLTLLQQLLQPQAHQLSPLLAVIASINGLAQGVSHSDGTLCKTQF